MYSQPPMSLLPIRSRTLEQEPSLAYISLYVFSISLRSTVGSSHYSKVLPIINPTEDALVRKVDEIGHQLEALKMKSEHPYNKGFNMAPTFTSDIMEEPVPL